MKMKSIIAVVAVALGIGANAATEKIFTVQLANKEALVQASTTAGNLVGYPMLGMMATMGLADNPVNEELGEFRAGENMLVVFYADPDKVTTVDDFDDALAGGAIVYAPAKSKQDFLLSKPSAKETDGIIDIGGGFVTYTEDEKWAVAASSAEFAKLAIADVAEAQKPMDGDFASVRLFKPGVKIYSKLLSNMTQEFADAGLKIRSLPSATALLDSIECGNFGLRLGDAGLDIRGACTPVADSDLAKICAKPLEGDSLAFAPADAVYVVAGAEGVGCDFAKLIAIYDGLVAAIKDSGINTDWYKSVNDGTTFNVSLDFPAAVKYFMSEEGQAAANAVSAEGFQQKVLALYDYENADMYKINPESKPFSFALSLKGVDSKQSVSDLFAKVMPEAEAKKPCAKSVYRYYSAVKAVIPALVALVPENTASVFNATIATLPSDADAGIASAVYRDGSDLAFAARVSAQEIRGFAAIFNAAAAYFAMAEAENCECGVDDEDDEDDEGSEDEE